MIKNKAQAIKVGMASLLVIAIVGIWYGYSLASTHSRQAEVAARGAQVMPFDLEETTHVFEKMDDGGLQRVTANEPSNMKQIELIQAHLQEEADALALRESFSAVTFPILLRFTVMRCQAWPT